MPSYEFRCPSCGKAEEVYRRLSEGASDVQIVCTDCDRPMERVYSARFAIWGTKVRP